MNIETYAERDIACDRMQEIFASTGRMRSFTADEQREFDRCFAAIEAFDRAQALDGDRSAHRRVLAYDCMPRFDAYAPAYGSCCGPVSAATKRGRVEVSNAPPPDPRDAVLSAMRAGRNH